VFFIEPGHLNTPRAIKNQNDAVVWQWNSDPFGKAWAKNVGWRIDYHIVTPGLRGAIQRAAIYKDQRFSDHAPLIVEYDVAL